METETLIIIINLIVTVFIIGSIPFFLIGTNKEFNKNNSSLSNLKLILAKTTFIVASGLIALIVGALMMFFIPSLDSIINLYDSQMRLPFIGGVGSLIFFTLLTFAFNFYTSLSNDKVEDNS